MRSRFLIGLSSIALMNFAALGVATAQNAAAPAPAPAPTEQKADTAAPGGPADNQIANEVDARIAQLKASLRLTTDQEKNWSGLQSALHDFGIVQMKGRIDDGMRRYDRRDRDDRTTQAERPDDIALMRRQADQLTARAASLKTLANAAEPLYGALDDRQKRKLMGFMSEAFEFRRR